MCSYVVSVVVSIFFKYTCTCILYSYHFDTSHIYRSDSNNEVTYTYNAKEEVVCDPKFPWHVGEYIAGVLTGPHTLRDHEIHAR